MKYKVRVTKAPDNDTMAYGGQSGYGLDLGQRGIYDTMNQSPFDSVSDTAQPVPRESANIEAERNETMVGDFDDDGRLEHMKIAGKPHSKGGTPLNVKPGTFVFSQTKKMAFGGPALQAFGKSGKTKYTPAQLAKQYDLNKYKAIMQDPDMQDDPIAQRTARMMYEHNAKKLGMLALIQEGMKGFPQGIPDIAQSVMPMGASLPSGDEAKYGGYFAMGGELESYQTKGQVTPRPIKTKEEFERLKASGKYKHIGNNVWEYYNKTVIPGTQDQTIIHKGTPAQKYVGNPTAAWRAKYNTPEKIAAYNKWKREQLAKDVRYTGTPDRTEVIKGKPEEVNEERDLITYNDENPPVPNTPFVTQPSDSNYGQRPFFGNSLFVAPKRERFYAAPINAVMPDPTFYDPNRMLAANAEQANITKQYLAGFGSPQAFMANSASTDAKAFENAANINSDYQNKNVGVANQFSPMRAEIMNRTNAANADRADKLFWNNEQGNKAYNNSLRQWLNNIDRYRENEYEVNTGTNLLNQTNPYYDMVYGRKGASMRFKPGVNVSDLITNGGSGKSAALTPDRMQAYERAVANYTAKKMTDAQMRPLLEAQFPEFFTDVRSSSRNLADVNAGYLGQLARRGVIGSGPSSIIGQ